MITIAPKNYVGVQSVFHNLERIGLSKNVYLDDLILPIEDNVLLGGWHDTYPMIIKHVPKHLTYSFLWTSSIYEAEVMGEMDYLYHIVNNTKPSFVWCGKKSVSEFLNAMMPDIDINIVHYPYPLYDTHLSNIKKRRNCGLFCPPTPKKNLSTNVAGWIISNKKKKSKLFTNLPNIRGHDIVYVPWMSNDEYDTLIRTLKIGLQVDISSSFNYVAYDFLIRGIPCLISPSIANNMKLDIDDIIVRDIDDAIELSDKILNIMSLSKDEYAILSSKCKDSAVDLHNLNKEILLNEIPKLFEN